ncbi:MAG: TniB family NTP-binding protein [Campylobacterales bacterium]
MSDSEHLSNLLPETRLALSMSDKDRLHTLRTEKWFGYPTAVDILDSFKELLDYPRKPRMPGTLLVGETNNGKTSILSRFVSLNPSYEGEEATIIPVMSVQAPPSPDLSAFYSQILHRLAVPYRNTDKTSKKEQLVHHYFALCSVRMLIVDEIHNILSGTVPKQKVFMNALKNLSNELMIPIVLAGIPDALHATNTDSQISNRFKPVFLPRWKLDRSFLSLLASIEKTLPLKKPSNLGTTKELALAIADQAEGYIGEIVELVTKAAELAIKNGVERITKDEIQLCGFVKPSMRKSHAEIAGL